MAGPGLSTTRTTANTAAEHAADHNAAHAAVNLLDTANTAAAGFVPVGNGTALVTRVLLSTDLPGVVTNSRTASYTLVLSDAGKLVEMNVATANTLTIPLNSAVAFPIGTSIIVRQYGAGLTTFAITAGGTLNSLNNSKVSAGQHAGFTLTKRGTDEWQLEGALA